MRSMLVHNLGAPVCVSDMTWLAAPATSAPAGALMVNDDAHVLLNNCTFQKNWATYGSGGSIYASDRAKLTASNVLFRDNVATWVAAHVCSCIVQQQAAI